MSVRRAVLEFLVEEAQYHLRRAWRRTRYWIAALYD